MDESQFRDILRAFEEHNKAFLNCQMMHNKELISALNHSQKDHDLLTQIVTMLSGCQTNCKAEKATNKEHRDESVVIRDMVKKNDRIVGGFCKFGWIVVAALIATVQVFIGWVFKR